MKTIAVFAIFAFVVAAAYGAAVEVEKPVEKSDVSPIREQDAAAAVAPKEDLKGAETAYVAPLPYVAPAVAHPAVYPYAAYPYYRYSYPYAAYPYALPATYYLRR